MFIKKMLVESVHSVILSVLCLQLLDLCVLDVESLQFTYSVLAAAALYHSSTRELALSVSGNRLQFTLI